MNILIDIGHPAHVHLFKNVGNALNEKGHQVFYSVREIPVAKRLLDHYGIEYINLGGKKDSLLGKAKTVLAQDLKLWRFVEKNKIDIGLSSGIVLSHVSLLTPMKSFVFDDDDDEVEKLVVKYGHPFSEVVFTPDGINRASDKRLFYKGTHELSYLHPSVFKPDENVLEKAGIKKGERFFILRFVAFKGHHDVGESGISDAQRLRLIEMLEKYGRVIITSERELDAKFEKYRLPVPPEDIHSLMYYSSMFIGDSQTMTTEAALLGVPALKCNSFAGRLTIPNLLEEKYGLCYAYRPENFDKMIAKAKDLLNDPDTPKLWEEKKKKFIKDMINPTDFFVWFIENYPDSNRIMKENPDYQNRFK